MLSPIPDAGSRASLYAFIFFTYFVFPFAFFLLLTSRQIARFPRILTATSFASSTCCDSCLDLLSMVHLNHRLVVRPGEMKLPLNMGDLCR